MHHWSRPAFLLTTSVLAPNLLLYTAFKPTRTQMNTAENEDPPAGNQTVHSQTFSPLPSGSTAQHISIATTPHPTMFLTIIMHFVLFFIPLVVFFLHADPKPVIDIVVSCSGLGLVALATVTGQQYIRTTKYWELLMGCQWSAMVLSSTYKALSACNLISSSYHLLTWLPLRIYFTV